MSTPMRKHVWSGVWGGLLVGGSLLGGGCTAGSPPVALEQARTAYAQAEQTPEVVANAPVPLREAHHALQRAEHVWADNHDTEEVQHLAALASQRVDIARAAAEKQVAEAQIQQATEERDQVLLNARTGEAQRAQQQAAQATQEAQAAKPCHHFLYSGGEFVRLYSVNPNQTSNHAAKTTKAAVRAYKSALDI